MTKIKKILLGLSVAITMSIAFVVGLVGLNHNKPINNTSPNNEVVSEVKQPQKPTRPVKKELTFKPGEVQICKGQGTIDFSYSPDNVQGATSKAFEYKFNNPMSDTMAVNLDSIDTTGVTVSYAYSDTPLTRITSTNTLFEAQTIAQNGTKYIYIVVTSNSAIPTTFKTSIFWWQGKAGQLEIYNTSGTKISTQTIVKGQQISAEPYVDLGEGRQTKYWYLDSACTQAVTFNDETKPFYYQGQKLYTEIEGILDSDWLEWDNTNRCYYVKRGTSFLPNYLNIQSTYNDGTNGLANVTYIYGTSTSNGAFRSQTSLKSVDLPSTITSIGAYAFQFCSGLISIDISGCTGLTSIDNRAFSSCSGLTSVTLSGCTGLTSIGNYAFYECSGLTGIDLSGCTSLTSIGIYAFYNCSGLTSIVISTSLTSIDSGAFSGCYALAEVYNLSSLTITTGSSANGGIAGYAKVIHKSASEPTRIQTIDNMQYYVYGTDFIALVPTGRNITSVTLDSRTTEISEYAFLYSGELTGMAVEDGNIKYDSRNNCNAIIETSTNTLIAGCKNTIIPETVTSIGERAFYGCSGLTNITLPSSVTSIGEYAFYGCSGLTSITLPSSLTSISDGAFSSCSGLTSIDLSGCTSLTSIGSYAFSSCSGLTSITLPSSVTSIGSSAFYGCSGLTSITLPSSVTSIEGAAFRGCSGLTSITLPSSLTSIGNYVFDGCSGLTSITLPSSLTKIGYQAFYGCSNLSSITFEDTSTWYYTSDSNYIGGTEFTIVAGTNYATEFKETYSSYYWYKV